MKYLFIVNDSPYGSQRAYNALRLAVSVARSAESEVRVFLFGDGVTGGLGQVAPMNSFYNTQEMLAQIARSGGEIGACKTCLEQRGISDEMLLQCVKRRTLDDLTAWTELADKVLCF